MALIDNAAGGITVRPRKRVESALSPIVVLLGIAWPAIAATGSEPAGLGDALVIRLVHPERQAAAVLSLFEGSRAAHPAAALAAWKRATHDPNRLGKSVEAVIAFFNPEMAAECRIFRDAELHLNLDPANGKARWFAIVPHDDGTLAAAVTAARLSDGAEEGPVVDEGHPLAVVRLGKPGAPLSIQFDDALVVAGSRDELLRGLRRIRVGSGPGESNQVQPIDTRARDVRSGRVPGTQTDSGLIFDADPAGLAGAGAGSLELRRAVELIRGLGHGRLWGNLALRGDRLDLELTSALDPATRVAHPAATIDPAWLDGIPSAHAMGVISLAIEPSAAFWSWAFALADRVERLDPARASLAPLRSRINLLAVSAGARPEADLWPHLRGVTLSVMGEPDQPGRPTGFLLALHADTEPSAARLANEFLPRLGALLPGGNRGAGPASDAPAGKTATKAAAGEVRRMGKLGGRAVVVWRRDRNVLVAWGEDALIESLQKQEKPERSVAAFGQAWARKGRGVPQRVGVVWPARCLPPPHGLDAATPAFRALADDPPVVWWGWSDTVEAHDSIECPELRERVRRFLDRIPQNLPQTR